jgi:hypothetical protein
MQTSFATFKPSWTLVYAIGFAGDDTSNFVVTHRPHRFRRSTESPVILLPQSSSWYASSVRRRARPQKRLVSEPLVPKMELGSRAERFQSLTVVLQPSNSG